MPLLFLSLLVEVWKQKDSNWAMNNNTSWMCIRDRITLALAAILSSLLFAETIARFVLWRNQHDAIRLLLLCALTLVTLVLLYYVVVKAIALGKADGILAVETRRQQQLPMIASPQRKTVASSSHRERKFVEAQQSLIIKGITNTQRPVRAARAKTGRVNYRE